MRGRTGSRRFSRTRSGRSSLRSRSRRRDARGSVHREEREYRSRYEDDDRHPQRPGMRNRRKGGPNLVVVGSIIVGFGLLLAVKLMLNPDGSREDILGGIGYAFGGAAVSALVAGIVSIFFKKHRVTAFCVAYALFVVSQLPLMLKGSGMLTGGESGRKVVTFNNGLARITKPDGWLAGKYKQYDVSFASVNVQHAAFHVGSAPKRRLPKDCTLVTVYQGMKDFLSEYVPMTGTPSTPKSLTAGDLPGISYMFQETDKGKDVQNLLVFIEGEKDYYILCGVSLLDDYPAVEPVFMRMISSIREE